MKQQIVELPNGVRIVTDPMAEVRSCSLGIWLATGSGSERAEEAGLSHFAEHMLFKGTDQYDAFALSNRMNGLGGNFNAFTSQEALCLHARTVEHKAHQALELLLQMLCDSTFPAGEIVRERNVILEEQKMYEDSPDDQVLDVYMKNLWPKHALGRPVIGTRAEIARFSRPRLMKFWGDVLRPGALVVSIAGAFDRPACMRLIKRYLGGLKPRKRRSVAGGSHREKPLQRTLVRPIEQTHFCFGAPAPHRHAPERFAFGMLNMILGGGMSSRLFQEVREKRGLAYSISSFMQLFDKVGCYAVVGGTSPQYGREVIELCLDQLRLLREQPVSDEELAMAREQLVDAALMRMESTSQRMMHQAECLLHFGRLIALEETLEHFQRVTVADIQRVARRYLAPERFAVSVIGPEPVPVAKIMR